MSLKGKNVVVVGGFGGIGLETCKCFLQKQIARQIILQNLAILDLRSEESVLKQLQKEYPSTSIIFIPLDITKKTDIKAAFKRITESEFKYIDILVNSAGVVADNDPELTINVNLLGLINTTLIAFTHMSKSEGGKGGLIVNIASVLGLEPCAPIAIYSASKYGVIGFTRSMASPYYYDKTGIALMAICPGVTDTNLIKNVQGRTTFPSDFDFAKKLIAHQQKPEDCARNIIEAVETNKNGSIWISKFGKLQEVHLPKYWTANA